MKKLIVQIEFAFEDETYIFDNIDKIVQVNEEVEQNVTRKSIDYVEEK